MKSLRHGLFSFPEDQIAFNHARCGQFQGHRAQRTDAALTSKRLLQGRGASAGNERERFGFSFMFDNPRLLSYALL
jgi:hypothetical protein